LENLFTPALQDGEHIDLHRYVDKSLNMLKKNNTARSVRNHFEVLQRFRSSIWE